MGLLIKLIFKWGRLFKKEELRIPRCFIFCALAIIALDFEINQNLSLTDINTGNF